MSDLFDNPPITGSYPCAWCGAANDRSLSLGDPTATPDPGAVLLCIECAKPSIEQEHGKPRRPTETEWAKINDDPIINKTRKEIFMRNKGNVAYRDLEVRVNQDEG